MSPLKYFRDNEKEHIKKVAAAAGTSYAYFEQLARGYRTPSLKLAKKLHKETGVPVCEWITELKDVPA